MTGVVEKVGQAGENVSGGARNGVKISYEGRLRVRKLYIVMKKEDN